MFVLVGVIVVLCVNPLFFYLPVINENSQCIKLDNRLKIAATYLRLFFDTIFLTNVIFGFIFHHKSNLDEDHATPEFKKKCFKYLDLVIDILALLPIPQARETFLLLFIYFSFISLYILSISYSYTCYSCNLSRF
jgi:cyclic nucleotide gated channel